ncbi:MAG: hypothetical protein COB02_07040 [Candidatus Cloacimonadota bacterium]|nr:MAG: hypothetical protein COB02_07040 [Candidatus Cloacimonadota bacterium]
MIFLYLILATFFVSFGMGFVKFFIVGHLAIIAANGNIDQISAQKEWIMQIVASVFTLGPSLIFFLSGPLAASTNKRLIMLSTGIISGALFFGGFLSGWVMTAWLYVAIIGLTLGIFNSAKMASVPLLAKYSKHTTIQINSTLTVMLVVAMIIGIIFGEEYQRVDPELGAKIGGIALLLAGFFGSLVKFPDEDLVPFKKSSSTLVEESFYLFTKYWAYLISGPMLWGCSSAVSLAITTYCEKLYIGTSAQCAYLLGFAALGTIIGSILAPRFQSLRFITAFIAGFFFFLMTVSFPFIIKAFNPSLIITENLFLFKLSAFLVVILSMFFGICANLIDSEYLRLVGVEKKEGTGAAFQSAWVAFFCFAVGIVVGGLLKVQILNETSQFIFIGLFIFASILPILTLLPNSEKGYIISVRLLAFFMKKLVNLRYKVKIEGLDELKGKKGLLILPNHPAELDPLILGSNLLAHLNIKPLVTETFYTLPILNQLLNFVKAIPVPDMDQGTSYFKLKRMNKVFTDTAQSLEDGENVLLYPAGRLMRDGVEDMKGASAVDIILKANPNITVVLARTTGMWGSLSSTAHTAGITPDPGPLLLRVLKIVTKNLFFFIPKRPVHIKLEIAPNDFPYDADKNTRNEWLENYYNQGTKQEIVPISLCRWYQELPETLEKSKNEEIDVSSIDQEIIDKVILEFSKMLNKEPKDINLHDHINDDLGLDSLDRSEILIWLEDIFEVNNFDATTITTVASVVEIAATGGDSEEEFEVKVPEAWSSDTNRPDIIMPQADTVAHAMLLSLDRLGSHVCIADDNTGVLSNKKAKLAALLIASYLRKIDNPRIGVMLPASCGAALVVMACYFAGKVPVMVNWTLGSRNLDHVQNVSGIDVVISSLKFVDKLGSVDLGCLEDKLIFLEDLKKEEFTIFEKIKAALESKKSASFLLEKYKLNQIKTEDEAVILFTSGSETVPKGVSLSHKNILANATSTFEIIPFKADDAMYGFLPPFHSFGFTITTILPLTTGIKLSYYANPTEAKRLAHGINMWGSTIICGTPSFAAAIYKAGKKEQLQSVRFIVAGAEKVPDALFDKVTKTCKNTLLVEGYGITECSPMISANRPGRERAGVGIAVDAVTVKIVDIDTKSKLLPQGERGLIIVKGTSVFDGYIGENAPNPFIEVDGESWYNTGDLGYLDKKDNLILAGRLKRFVKIAGEMISIPAMESVLVDKWPAGEEGPIVAIEALEIEGERPIMCLFSSLDITVDEGNTLLKEAGFSNVGRLNKSIKVEQIPLLGTGKTDYRSLKSMLS